MRHRPLAYLHISPETREILFHEFADRRIVSDSRGFLHYAAITIILVRHEQRRSRSGARARNSPYGRYVIFQLCYGFDRPRGHKVTRLAEESNRPRLSIVRVIQVIANALGVRGYTSPLLVYYRLSGYTRGSKLYRKPITRAKHATS